ncbi:MAG: VWA domain-containing protein [Pseudomonadota bacterium]
MFPSRLTALAAVAALMTGPTQAADDVMVVFDGSNSMWGQIDGVAKIEIARDAMERLLGDWATQTNVGLMAYGHRTRGDCSDIETIIAPGPFDRERYLSQVREITPTGKTPLTTAVEMAAEQLSYRDRPATVVLISDGIESCNRDPCALAEALERGGVNFTAHVVGFGLATEQERASLACIAENTGGEFIAAADANELEEALDQVSVAVAEQPAAPADPEPEPEPQPEPSVEITLTAPETVVIGSEFDVAWSETIDARDRVTIVPAGADADTIGPNARTRDRREAPLRAPAEAGLYELRYVVTADGSVAGTRMIEVVAAEVALDVPGSAVAGSAITVGWSTPVDARDLVTIVPVGTDAGKIENHLRVRDKLEGDLRVPSAPGLYEVRYVLDVGRVTLAVASIEVTEPGVTLTAPEMVVAGAQFDVAWSTLIDARDLVTIVPSGTEEGKIENHLRVRANLDGKLQAPSAPGFYEVRYVLDEGRRTLAAATVEVTEPEATISAPETVLAGARFSVSWGAPIAARDLVTIVPAGADEGTIEKHLRVRANQDGQLVAPGTPGLYEVRYVLDEGRRTLAITMVEVTEPEVTLTAPETVRASGEIDVAWTGDAPNQQDIVTVVPLGADPGQVDTHVRIRANTSAKLRAPDQPGLYEVRYVLDSGRRTLAAVQVEVVDANAPLDTGGSIEAPPTGTPGQTVEVSWSTASTSTRIRVSLAGLDQADFTWIEAKPAGEGPPLSFTLPDAPGTYEFRLLDLAGPEVLSRAIIEVR